MRMQASVCRFDCFLLYNIFFFQCLWAMGLEVKHLLNCCQARKRAIKLPREKIDHSGVNAGEQGWCEEEGEQGWGWERWGSRDRRGRDLRAGKGPGSGGVGGALPTSNLEWPLLCRAPSLAPAVKPSQGQGVCREHPGLGQPLPPRSLWP